VLGSEDDVRRCVQAHLDSDDPKHGNSLKTATRNFSDGKAFARTVTDEREATRSVVSYLARRGGTQTAPNQAALAMALAQYGYSASETRVVEGGFEKHTRSAFGLFGEVVKRFSPH